MSNPAPGFDKHPAHRVDIRPAAERVRVYAGDRLIADSEQALLVEESRHDPVYYLPEQDVDTSQLQSSTKSSYCPFKGHASYFSVVGEPALADSVWSYQDPYDECLDLARYLAFYTDRVAVTRGD